MSQLRPDLSDQPPSKFLLLAEGTHAGYPWEVWAHMKHGHRCGYVGIPKGHPWFDLPYNKIGENDDCYECGRAPLPEWTGEVRVPISYGFTVGDFYIIGFARDLTCDLADPELNAELGEIEAEENRLYPKPWECTVKTTEFCIDECQKLCEDIYGKSVTETIVTEIDRLQELCHEKDREIMRLQSMLTTARREGRRLLYVR